MVIIFITLARPHPKTRREKKINARITMDNNFSSSISGINEEFVHEGQKIVYEDEKENESDTKLNQCSICGRTFPKNWTRTHSCEKKFGCCICGGSFFAKKRVYTHVRHHHKVKCSPFSAYDEFVLKIEEDDEIENPKKMIYSVEEENMEFINEDSEDEIINEDSVHESKTQLKNEYTCTICQNIFTKVQTFIKHSIDSHSTSNSNSVDQDEGKLEEDNEDEIAQKMMVAIAEVVQIKKKENNLEHFLYFLPIYIVGSNHLLL